MLVVRTLLNKYRSLHCGWIM